MGHHRWRASVGVFVLAATIGATIPVTASADESGAENAPRFADGAWAGHVVYSVSANLSQGGVTAQAKLEWAHFEMQVTGGSVSGTFEGVGTGSADVPGGSGNAIISLKGTLGGDAAHPVVMPTTFSESGTITIQGMPFHFEYPFDASGLKTGTFEIVEASCDFVKGTFEQSVSLNLAGTGSTPTTLTATFSALRQSESTVGPGVAPLNEALQQLMDTASQILQALQQNGEYDPAQVFELVKSAESFDASLQKNSACGFVDDTHTFGTAITGVVTQMLQLAFGPLADKFTFTTAQLADLLFAGVSTGAVGTGAIDEKTANEIEAAAKAVFTARLDAAITSGSKSDIQVVLEISIAMGWSTLEADAKSALKKLK